VLWLLKRYPRGLKLANSEYYINKATRSALIIKRN